jgi:hypothetical protein
MLWETITAVVGNILLVMVGRWLIRIIGDRQTAEDHKYDGSHYDDP